MGSRRLVAVVAPPSPACAVSRRGCRLSAGTLRHCRSKKQRRNSSKMVGTCVAAASRKDNQAGRADEPDTGCDLRHSSIRHNRNGGEPLTLNDGKIRGWNRRTEHRPVEYPPFVLYIFALRAGAMNERKSIYTPDLGLMQQQQQHRARTPRPAASAASYP